MKPDLLFPQSKIFSFNRFRFKNSHLTFFLAVFMLFIGSGCNEKEDILYDGGKHVADKAAYLSYLRQEILGENKISTRTGDYSSSEAVDFLNEGLNFMYCRPDTSYAESLFFLDSVEILLNGSGRIDEEDLEEALEDMALFAGDKFYNEARSDKIPVMFNVRQISATIISTEMEVTFVMEAGANNLVVDIYPYEFDWIYGEFGADVSEECNEEEIDADAADLLRRDLRKALVYRSKVDPPYYFKRPYTVCFSPSSNSCSAEEIPLDFFPADEVIDPWEIINEEDITPNDNFEEYYLFYNYSGTSNYHDCLSDNEMNFHYGGMHTLAEDVLPSPVGNNVISQIEVGYDLLIGTFSTIFHSMVVTRSIRVSVIEEEFEDAIPLPN